MFNTKLPTSKLTTIKNKITQNIMLPSQSSYRIENDNIVFQFKNSDHEIYSYQNKKFIDIYAKRYNDLYSCCFNTNNYTIYDFADNDNIKIFKTLITNTSCTNITEEECLFFQRFYCHALNEQMTKSLAGNVKDYINGPDGRCACYNYDSSNKINIKLGIPINCFSNACKEYISSTYNTIKDPSFNDSSCSYSLCGNSINISNNVVDGNINITAAMNAACNINKSKSYVV